MLSMDDNSLRTSIQLMLEGTLEALNCQGDVEKKMEKRQRFIAKLKSSPVAILTEKANEQHYEVPTQFFKLVLGKRLKYSSALFPRGISCIDEAEEAMLDLVCKRARLENGMKVMDLGCGWGVTGLWVLEKYPNCHVTCVSNSNTQRIHIEQRAREMGFASRIQCVTADVNYFETSEKYDRIISIEMFEHMRNYDSLFRKVSGWLKNGGFLFTQILCHREFAYPFVLKEDAESEWMAENFFSGGTLPSADLFLYFQRDVILEEQWSINGIHYSKTLEAWLETLDKRKSLVLQVLRETYGKSQALKELGKWRKFFIYCSETFKFNNGNEWMVAHHLFSKRPVSKI